MLAPRNIPNAGSQKFARAWLTLGSLSFATLLVVCAASTVPWSSGENVGLELLVVSEETVFGG